jgi:hypothetical protein
MAEISNKALAILLVVAIAISLGGTVLSLSRLTQVGRPFMTGFAFSEGTALVNITSTASIVFRENTMDFGTGSVNTSAGNTECIMAVEDSGLVKHATAGDPTDNTTCVGFNAAASELTLENDGNNGLIVQLMSSVDNTSFIGGTNPKFRWRVVDNESNTCNTALVPANWIGVNTSSPGTQLCDAMDFRADNDSIDIFINLTIPYDSFKDQRTATLTATGTAI